MSFDNILDTIIGKDLDYKLISPLVLAYIGDSIFDLLIKAKIIGTPMYHVNDIHKTVIKLVNAHSQSEMMHKIQELLTDEERSVYKRGRNSRTVTPAKNQGITDYRRATGFEALFGYLFLKKNWSRIQELFAICMAAEKE
ncbi:MAG: ribonuclease III [Lachnospiraceae bacterium]|nr:ribonuclease III [Lachnospiraceae bacterium]